jgi:hypothetical protein
MKLANPIYDSVFKYLLDDNEVAKILISNILGLKIEALQLEPKEITLPSGKRDYTVFRIDFKATITFENQEKQVVLIEIQKAKLDSDIMRFRKYLGSQYLNENNTYDNQSTKAIPIYTIYFLGHCLAHSRKSPIINVNRAYIDNYSKEKLTEKEEFIECLTHNSIVVQIPLFKQFRRNRLEKLLSIFEASTRHEVEVEDMDDEDYKKITRRLVMANADEKVRLEMDVEDEIFREIDNRDRLIAELEGRELEERRQKEEERRQKEEERKQKEEERKQKEEERRQKEEATLHLKIMIKKLISKGFSVQEIADDLGKTTDEIVQLNS